MSSDGGKKSFNLLQSKFDDYIPLNNKKDLILWDMYNTTLIKLLLEQGDNKSCQGLDKVKGATSTWNVDTLPRSVLYFEIKLRSLSNTKSTYTREEVEKHLSVMQKGSQEEEAWTQPEKHISRQSCP